MSWFTDYAKTALKDVQSKIDKVLDIQDEEAEISPQIIEKANQIVQKSAHIVQKSNKGKLSFNCCISEKKSFSQCPKGRNHKKINFLIDSE